MKVQQQSPGFVSANTQQYMSKRGDPYWRIEVSIYTCVHILATLSFSDRQQSKVVCCDQ